MRFTLIILGSLFSVFTSAGVYKSIDANGDTEYCSNPCDAGHKKIEINVKTGSSTDLGEQENQQDLEQKKQQEILEHQNLEQQKQANKKRKAIDENAKDALVFLSVCSNAKKFYCTEQELTK